ncbi:MAG: hypothetical protein MI923_24465 [Phycisphaerales bacterium]|nr:hypothetical protein [Phycisphaerales bacterium]
MKNKPDDKRDDRRPDSSETADPALEETTNREATRRSFLRNVGKKAVYITPVLMTLTAHEARAQASPSNPS